MFAVPDMEVDVRALGFRTSVVVMALSMLVACSGGSAKQPRRRLDTTPAPGSMVVSDDTAGFAVSIPSSWVKLPTETASFGPAADAVKAQAPPAAATAVAVGLAQLKSVVRDGAALAAIDPSTGSTANLVIVSAGGQKVSEVAIGAANQLIGNGATDVSRTRVTADGLAAVRQRFRTPFPSDSGPVSLNENQLYVVRRGQAFILTLTGETTDLDGIAASLKLA